MTVVNTPPSIILNTNEVAVAQLTNFSNCTPKSKSTTSPLQLPSLWETLYCTAIPKNK